MFRVVERAVSKFRHGYVLLRSGAFPHARSACSLERAWHTRRANMRLLLLRHAETAWTITGQHTGRTDLELTPAGEAQARATSALFERVLAGAPLEALYASPRKRALR